MRATRSRTSAAAASGSRPTQNSIVTEERSFWLCEVIWRMPSMPGDRAFDELGDAALDDLVRGALVDRVDRDDRRVDLPDTRAPASCISAASPPTMSSRLTTTRKHGPADEEVGDLHGASEPVRRDQPRRSAAAALAAPAGASRPSVRWSASACVGGASAAGASGHRRLRIDDLARAAPAARRARR